MSLVKSKQRVADHGEVFTPSWMVESMLDLVKGETERIDSRFLEPACGDGNFLVPVLRRKLAVVELKYGKSDFERRHYALLGLMCLYGIELLPDNIAECRANLLAIFAEYLNLAPSDDLYRAAFYVLSQNLVHGDALTMRAHGDRPITFAEWGYLGKGRFQRRDFYWQIGRRIVEEEQGGEARAEYGVHLIRNIARALGEEFGNGMSVANLRNFRQFYLTFPDAGKSYALRSELSWTHWRHLALIKADFAFVPADTFHFALN